MRLQGKVALIAGAGTNMGRAVPILFAQEGAQVVLTARRAEPMAETAAFIVSQGGVAHTIQADLTREEDVERVFAVVRERFGRLDILYHNAGGYFSAEHDVARLAPDFWEGALRNNLRTFYLCVRQAVPLLIESGGGVILTVSAGEKVRLDSNSAYAAAKTGLIGAARNLARELYRHNIRVHALCPGLIWEPLPLGPVAPPPRRLERLGSAVDVAYAALYLASDEAAWLTGLVLDIDGGDHLFVDSPVRRAALERR